MNQANMIFFKLQFTQCKARLNSQCKAWCYDKKTKTEMKNIKES